MPVEHEALRTREHEAIATAARNHRDFAGTEAAARLGDGERRETASLRDRRQPFPCSRALARGEQRRRRQAHTRQERRAEQRCAHFFEQRNQLDEAESRAAVLFGDRDTGPAELRRDALPRAGVEAEVARHRGAHLLGSGVIREERARRATQFLLLLGEDEFHRLCPVDLLRWHGLLQQLVNDAADLVGLEARALVDGGARAPAVGEADLAARHLEGTARDARSTRRYRARPRAARRSRGP